MIRFKVTGNMNVTITKEVIAKDEEEAIELAYELFGGVENYCGNGGMDKLIGVDNEDETIDADGEIEFTDTEVLEEDVEVEEEFTVDINNVTYKAPEGTPQEVLDNLPTTMYGYIIISYESDLTQDLCNEIEESDDYQEYGIQVLDVSYTITNRERTEF